MPLKLKITSHFLLAALSGIMLGLVFYPFNFWFLAFLALLPLFYNLYSSKSLFQLIISAFITGTIAVGIITWPLTSASTWTGWAELSSEGLDSLQSKYQIALILMWCAYAVVNGGILFTVFALTLKWFSKHSLSFALLIVAPILWLLIVEYGRTFTFFDYHWSPLGTVFINLPQIAQLASYGGIWLLGGIIIFINSSIYLVVLHASPAKTRFIILIICGSILSILSLVGVNRYNNLENTSPIEKPIKTALIQLNKKITSQFDYTSFFMNKHYLGIIEKAYQEHSDKIDILVLPESIGFGGVSLDGKLSKNTPDKTLSNIKQWNDAISPLITKPSLLIMGLDTVDNTLDHNSIIVWNQKKPIWRYHKQRLVPLAEYIPAGFSALGLKGKSTFAHGTAINNLDLKSLNIGFFICQEVLFSDIINNSILDGANILITVGNDGVFANPAVAEVNSIAAQFRAIESGRYIVRAMKSGISSIITPSGKLQNSIGVNENSLISSNIYPKSEITPYIWFSGKISMFKFLLGILLLLLILNMLMSFQNKTRAS